VGAWALKSVLGPLGTHLKLSLVCAGEGGLNDGCGADYVKLKQAAPAGCKDLVAGQRYATVDGDADRLMYFFNNGTGFSLLDGDRLALLLADFMAELLAQAGLASGALRLGLVQTAYANGASTEKAVQALGAENGVRKDWRETLSPRCTGNGHRTLL